MKIFGSEHFLRQYNLVNFWKRFGLKEERLNGYSIDILDTNCEVYVKI